MSKPNVLILRAAGTNCDREAVQAFELAGARTELVHVNQLVAAPQRLDEFQVLVIPGGFTYGDDVAAGKVLAVELTRRLGDRLRDFVAADRLVLGICNGFQVLIKTGLLPGGEGSDGRLATLTDNDSQKFEDRWVHLAVADSPCVFTRSLKPGARLFLPVAHGEGKFVTAGPQILQRLRDARQVVFRYVAADGTARPGYPANPNGAEDEIAGICDPTGRVLGLMPHPERHLTPYLHPAWTRRETQPAEGDGLAVFRNAVEYFG